VVKILTNARPLATNACRHGSAASGAAVVIGLRSALHRDINFKLARRSNIAEGKE
jgi:hypothetical protein